jgi:hypothetical protein
LNTIANLAIAAGVYGALRSGGRASAAGERLQRRSTERVSEANQKAKEADARAAEANLKAKEAAERAAKAELALEKFRAPRTLDSEQMDRIAEKLRPFSGVEYDAATSSIDPEFMALLGFIEVALGKAGWAGI